MVTKGGRRNVMGCGTGSETEYGVIRERLLAGVVDFLIVSVTIFPFSMLLFPIYFVIIASFPTAEAALAAMIVYQFGGRIALYWLYFALAESSRYQTTLGKLFFDMKVTTTDGRRISFGKASLRFLGKLPTALTFGVALYSAKGNEKRQALHDRLAGTVVIKTKKR
jgi:uncharacterized RDD family membrane protein YckC